MKQLFIIPLLLISLISSPSWGADYKKGLTAYQNRDFATVLKEWKPLAEQGYANSQSILGFLYEKGKGVPQDFIYAHMWWNIAASNGIESAREMLKRIEKKITTSDISEAQRLARECVKKNYKGC